MRLLHVLVHTEPAIRAKLKRLHDSQSRAATWSCWTPEKSALLKQLYAEQWRTLPSLRGGPASLARVLSQPLLMGAARTSPIACIFRILLATALATPQFSALPIATSGLAILRATRDRLGDGT